MAESPKSAEPDDVVKYLRANLLLQLRESFGAENEGLANLKPEVLLNRAGFSRQEIADLLGKSYEAVKKVLQGKTARTTKHE